MLPNHERMIAAIIGPPANPIRNVVCNPGIAMGMLPTATPSTMPVGKIGTELGTIERLRAIPQFGLDRPQVHHHPGRPPSNDRQKAIAYWRGGPIQPRPD